MQRPVSTSAIPSNKQRKRRYPLVSLLGKPKPRKTKEQLIEDIIVGTQSLLIAKQQRTSNVEKDDIDRSRKAKSRHSEDSTKSTRSIISVTENSSEISWSSTPPSKSFFQSTSALQNHLHIPEITTPTTSSSSVDNKLSSKRVEQVSVTFQEDTPRSGRSTRSIHRLSKRNSDLSRSSSDSSSAKKPRSFNRRHFNRSAVSTGNITKDQQQRKPNSRRSVLSTNETDTFEETAENVYRPKSTPNLMAVHKRQTKARILEPSSGDTRRQSRLSSERKKLRCARMGSLKNRFRKTRAESPSSTSRKNAGYIMSFLGPPGSSLSKDEDGD